MTYQPPPGGLWTALLADHDGYLITVPEALDLHGPECTMTVSVRRLSALPTEDRPEYGRGVFRLPDPADETTVDEHDIAVSWTLDITDGLGETDHIDRQLAMAQAMAAGLNGAPAPATARCGTGLAAALHGLADRIDAFDGAMPDGYQRLAFYFVNTNRVAQVDAFGAAVLGAEGRPDNSGGSWYHTASVDLAGLRVVASAHIEAPPTEDPTVLRAEIAALRAQLAATGGAQ